MIEPTLVLIDLANPPERINVNAGNTRKVVCLAHFNQGFARDNSADLFHLFEGRPVYSVEEAPKDYPCHDCASLGSPTPRHRLRRRKLLGKVKFY
jgi:hypothetical protein